MSLPLGHAFAGITVACLGRETPRTRRADLAGLVAAVILAGLPDLDFLLYWVMPDKDAVYHLRHTASHSLLSLAVVAGVFCLFWRPFGSRRRTWVVAWVILASHVVLDVLCRQTPVALLWPVVRRPLGPVPLLPDVEIHGNMSVLASGPFVAHLVIEGLIGLIVAVIAYMVTRRRFVAPPTPMGVADEAAVSESA